MCGSCPGRLLCRFLLVRHDFLVWDSYVLLPSGELHSTLQVDVKMRSAARILWMPWGLPVPACIAAVKSHYAVGVYLGCIDGIPAAGVWKVAVTGQLPRSLRAFLRC